MKYAGVTVDDQNNLIEIYECEECGMRAETSAECQYCLNKRIVQNHVDEGVLGIL